MGDALTVPVCKPDRPGASEVQPNSSRRSMLAVTLSVRPVITSKPAKFTAEGSHVGNWTGKPAADPAASAQAAKLGVPGLAEIARDGASAGANASKPEPSQSARP